MSSLRGSLQKLPTITEQNRSIRVKVGIKKDGKQVPTVRARFDEWAIDFSVKWQPTLTNQDVIIGILQVAGENIGLGALRPEKSGRHMYGTFAVQYEEEE